MAYRPYILGQLGKRFSAELIKFVWTSQQILQRWNGVKNNQRILDSIEASNPRPSRCSLSHRAALKSTYSEHFISCWKPRNLSWERMMTDRDVIKINWTPLVHHRHQISVVSCCRFSLNSSKLFAMPIKILPPFICGKAGCKLFLLELSELRCKWSHPTACCHLPPMTIMRSRFINALMFVYLNTVQAARTSIYSKFFQTVLPANQKKSLVALTEETKPCRILTCSFWLPMNSLIDPNRQHEISWRWFFILRSQTKHSSCHSTLILLNA